MPTAFDILFRGEVKIGTRVRVFSADRQQDLGLGTYNGDVPIKVALNDPMKVDAPTSDDNETIDDDVAAQVEDVFSAFLVDSDKVTTPQIALDSGGNIYGFMCWWEECDEVPQSVH